MLLLRDGRVLAWDEYGDLGGRAVLWFHGAPSCRLEGRLFAEWASANGVRVIVPDRPGMGRSTPSPGATVGSWSSDVVALLDHLGLARVSVMGGSGGGPYVLGLAACWPERVDDVVVLAGGGVDPAGRGASGWVDRVAGWLAWRAPRVLGAYFSVMRALRRLPVAWVAAVPGVDAGLVALVGPVLSETFAQGVRGAVADFRRLGGPWGFGVGEIGVRVLVIQGDVDAFVPVRQARHFAARIPEARLEVVKGAGHVGVIRDWERVSVILGWSSERSDGA